MIFMILIWIFLFSVGMYIAMGSRKSLLSYPKDPQPMWWRIWDFVSFIGIVIGALAIAMSVFINLEPQARFFTPKEPLTLNTITKDNANIFKFSGLVAGDDIPRVENAQEFTDNSFAAINNLEKKALPKEDFIIQRARETMCTIEVSIDDVTPTGCYVNTDFGFLYTGGSTGSGRPGRRGSPYFEGGFTEQYMNNPLALLGPYTEYYQVKLPSGEKIIALFDRYYYMQLKAAGKITLPVGKLTFLEQDGGVVDMLNQKISPSVTGQDYFFRATSDKYRSANWMRLIASWITFVIALVALCKVKRCINWVLLKRWEG